MDAGPSSVSGLVPWVVTMWCSPMVMTSIEGPGCAGDVVGSRLSLMMGKLPSPSSFTWASRSWFLVQYPILCCWSRYHLSFINSMGICCAVLGSSMMYPLSWSSRDWIQCPFPCTSVRRSFWVLLCISTHSPVLGISMQRAASVVKLDLCHGSTGPWVRVSMVGVYSKKESMWSVACWHTSTKCGLRPVFQGTQR